MNPSFERPRVWSIREKAALIDERCDRYEKEWNAPVPPRVEDYLEGVEGDVRNLLWLELVMVDQQLRQKRGEAPTFAEYKERCPDERILLDVSTDGRAFEVQDPSAAADESSTDAFLTTAGLDDDATSPVHLPSTIGVESRDRAATPASQLQAWQGMVLGDYELIEKLGEGGMGIVFKARQRRLNRIVALKMIRSGVLASHREVRLFQREAEAVAALDHPNIVSIFETGIQGDLLFYSMKLIAGRNLQESLFRFQNQPAAIAKLVVTVADAICHAHERGVLHRDLKPSNILVDDSGEPSVIDFGLAKLLESDESTMASAGSAAGTPSYMAPEQAQGQRDQITTATDVYGLGTLLYTLLTGRCPFRADTAQETIRQVIHQEPRRPRALDPHVDPDLETICLKCLEKEPRNRYVSARELAEDLQRWRAGKPIIARPVSTAERVWKYARRHPWGSGMVGLLVLTFTLGSGGIVWQWRQAVAARAGMQLALGVAQLNEDAALKSEDYALHLAYAAKLNLAQRDWQDAFTYAAGRRLDETRPRPGKADLRGFEWYYLDHLCHAHGQTLAGHWEVVWSVVYSPDGKRLASAGKDETVKLWDAATGRLIRSIKTTPDRDVHAVVFHPDAARLASAGGDQVVTLWDAATGQPIRTFPGHTKAIWELAISGDGKLLASSSNDGTVKLWDVAAGTLVHTLQDHHPDNFGEIAFSPDGKILASAGGGDRTTRIWDVATGARLRTLAHARMGPGSKVVASPDAKNPDADSRLPTIHSRLPVVFSPDGKTIAAGTDDGTIELWNTAAGTRGRILVDFHNQSPLTELAFSPDGKTLASSSHIGQAVSLWDVATAYLLRTIKGHTAGITCIAFSPDGLHLASTGFDSSVRIWDTTKDQEARSLVAKEMIHDVAFGHDGSYVLSANLDGSVTLWDVATGQAVRTFVGHTAAVLGVAVSRDGRRAASGGEDHSVRIWEIATGKEIHVIKGHTGAVMAVEFSPSGKSLASASLDRTVKLWDVDTGREIKSFDGHSQGVTGVAFSPDGKTLASAGKDGFALVRDLDSGRQLQVIKGNGGGVRAMSLSPDGRLLATGGYDQLIVVWEVATGQKVHELKGHAGVIDDLAFSPDSRRLASASGDETVRIWDPVFGEELFVLRGHTSMVAGVAFSPDGTRLASAGSDRTVKIWEANTGADVPTKP